MSTFVCITCQTKIFDESSSSNQKFELICIFCRSTFEIMAESSASDVGLSGGGLISRPNRSGPGFESLSEVYDTDGSNCVMG